MTMLVIDYPIPRYLYDYNIRKVYANMNQSNRAISSYLI